MLALFPAFFFLTTTGRFDEQRHPSAADISPADVWMWSIGFIFLPSATFFHQIWSKGLRQFRVCVFMYISIVWSLSGGRFVNSACLLCASGMAAEQKVCCLGALSPLTHPHPPPFITMADGSRWILHNHVRTAPPIPIHLFKHISSDGEFTQRLKAATGRQRRMEMGRRFPRLRYFIRVSGRYRTPGVQISLIYNTVFFIISPSSSSFWACNVVNCGSGEVCFTSFQGHAPLGLFSRLERARNFTPVYSSLIPLEWVLRKFQITGLFSSPVFWLAASLPPPSRC